jgi:hypothetical protein
MPRYSTNEKDPGYEAFKNLKADGKTLLVYLDAKLVESVETADTDKGLVVRVVTDESGQMQTTPGDEDNLLREKLFGRVTVAIVPKVGVRPPQQAAV